MLYISYALMGLAGLCLLFAIVLIIVIASTKKYGHDSRLHVVNTRQKGLILDE